MAVFLINICKFSGCGITFPSLGDLIQHIEETHIDYDPQVVEQNEQSRPVAIPLSYALRFITDAARKESPASAFPAGSTGVELKRKLAIKHHSYSLSSSNRSSTPIGSDIDDDEMEMSDSDDSNDSWTTEEFSSEFIMKYGSRHSGNTNGSGNNEKPFACPVPGCKKRYKNVNGIKYHSKNGHKKDGKIRKSFKCHCGKSYKTSQGLKNHTNVAHSSSTSSTMLAAAMASSTAISDAGRSSPISISLLASSPSSSVSSLINSPSASICGGDLSSSSNCSNLSSSNNNLSCSLTTTQPASTASTLTKTNNNYSLITIKTKPALVKTTAAVTPASSGKKLIKIIQDDGSNSDKVASSTPKLDFSSATSASICGNSSLTSPTIKMSDSAHARVGSLMSLGILTPATSPSQVVQQQMLHNGSGTSSNGSDSGSTGMMPLTPISPNMTKNINFVASNEITILTEQT